MGEAFTICTEDFEAAAFLSRLPNTSNNIEILVQRGLLLEIALQYGVLAHRAFHAAVDDRVAPDGDCTLLRAHTGLTPRSIRTRVG